MDLWTYVIPEKSIHVLKYIILGYTSLCQLALVDFSVNVAQYACQLPVHGHPVCERGLIRLPTSISDLQHRYRSLEATLTSLGSSMN